MARPIRTPRRTDDPTLLSRLISTYSDEQDRQRAQRLEDEERVRRRSFEDTAHEVNRQLIDIRRGTYERNIQGIEPGPLDGVPEADTRMVPRNIFGVDDPSRVEGARGAGTLRPELVPDRAGQVRGTFDESAPGLIPDFSSESINSLAGRQPGVSFPSLEPDPRNRVPPPPREPATSQLAPAPQQQQQQQQQQRTPGSVLPPHRDPTIVHPGLMATAGPQQFDWTKFERDWQLPSGSVQTAFEDNPVGTINAILDKTKERGGANDQQLSQLRQLVQLRINAIEQQVMESVFTPEEEREKLDEIDALTIGLLEAVTGGFTDADPNRMAEELERLYPPPPEPPANATQQELEAANAAWAQYEEEMSERMERISTTRGRARDFAGRARRYLEPGR